MRAPASRSRSALPLSRRRRWEDKAKEESSSSSRSSRSSRKPQRMPPPPPPDSCRYRPLPSLRGARGLVVRGRVVRWRQEEDREIAKRLGFGALPLDLAPPRAAARGGGVPSRGGGALLWGPEGRSFSAEEVRARHAFLCGKFAEKQQQKRAAAAGAAAVVNT